MAAFIKQIVKEEENHILQMQNEYMENHSGYIQLRQITEEDIINKEYFYNIKDAVVCTYCKEFALELFQGKSADTHYCRKCYTEIFGNINGNNGKNVARNLLGKLIFKCRNNCGQTLPYDKVISHYIMECPKDVGKIRPMLIHEINSNEVINKDYLSQIADNIICPICKKIVFHPYSCVGCSKTYCFNCLRQKQLLNCLSCKQSFNLTSYEKLCRLERNETIQKIISKLRFKCRNGCEMEIGYYDLEKHYVSMCPKIYRLNSTSKGSGSIFGKIFMAGVLVTGVVFGLQYLMDMPV